MPEGTILRVFRFNPDRDGAPRYSSYRLPGEKLTVLAALRHIYEHLDPTLAFRGYCCNQVICGSCSVVLDGKPIRGCDTVLEPGREHRIEPMRDRPIIRDLVVDFGQERTCQVDGGTRTFLVARGTHVRPLRMGQSAFEETTDRSPVPPSG